MKVYRTKWDERIEDVEAERMTDKSVWINGTRNAVRTGYNNYFASWDEAKSFLVEKAETGLAHAKRKVDMARSRLETVKALKP